MQSYPIIVVLKRQNRLKVETDKPKQTVKMQSVSDDYMRKRLLKKPRFELTAKGVFRLGRCYIFRQGVPGRCRSGSFCSDGRLHGNRIDRQLTTLEVRVSTSPFHFPRLFTGGCPVSAETGWEMSVGGIVRGKISGGNMSRGEMSGSPYFGAVRKFSSPLE